MPFKERAREIFKDQRVIGGLILFAFVTILFMLSLSMRSSYMDYVARDHHHHLTATAVVFTNNWLDDGIVNDHFAMIPNTRSIEFPSLKDRSFYDSYPPGCIIPLYLLAKITGTNEITFGFVQRWNLFNQYMVTLLLAFIVYAVFLRLKLKFYIGAAAAVIPTVTNLFMSAPFYFFHSVYFSDMAVLLPFVLTVFIEVVLPCCKNRKLHTALVILEAVTIFAGTFTDYLYLCVFLVIYIKRLLLGEISLKSPIAWLKQSLLFALPLILAAALFVIQILVNGPVRILSMFLVRTGMDNNEDLFIENFETYFWKDYIQNGYGNHADILLKASLFLILFMIAACIIARLVIKFRDENIICVLSTAGMIIIPCFMQVYLLKNHSAVHDFSSLKFSLVMSVVPYVLIPLLIILVIRAFTQKFGKKFNIQKVTGVAMMFLVVLAVTDVYTNHKEKAAGFFPEPFPEYQIVGNFLKSNTDYRDVVFSDNYTIDESNNCPQKIAHSKKRVYPADNIQTIYDKVKDIPDDYIINIFSYGGPESGALKSITDQLEDVACYNNMYLYRIAKDDFLAMYGR